MTKTDLIKFRCTPAFKARVQREAAYRGATVSELVERALDAYLPQAGAPAVQTPPGLRDFITTTPVVQTAPPLVERLAPPPASILFGTCPHDRPRAACWECA